MSTRGLLLVLLIFVLTITTACSGQGMSAVAPVIKETTLPSSMPVNAVDPNCLGNKVNRIGEAISDEYEFADYDQVMTWFCSGAEFEDILVALETELQTDTTANEMLQMLADGFSWDDIWLVTGLTD